MAVTFSTLHHVGLIVTDFDKSVAFFSKLLDMKPTIQADVENVPAFDAQTQTSGAKAKVAFFTIDNSSVEVIQFVQPHESIEQVSVHRPGSKHVCFAVDDVDATYEAMLQEGYDFLAAPCHFGPEQGALNGVGFAYFLDPDGNVIEILEDPKKKSLLGRVGLSNPEDN